MSFALMAANGDALAVFENELDSDRWRETAAAWLDEAASCGHPRAAAWVGGHYPLAVRALSAEERAEILEDGTPLLQREP